MRVRGLSVSSTTAFLEFAHEQGVRLSDGTDFRIAYAAETAVITAIQRNAQPLSAHDLIWQDRSLMRKDAATGVWLVVIPDPTKGEVDIQGPVL